MCLPRSGELAPSKRPLVTRGVALIYLGRVLIQSQLVTANLINVRFGPTLRTQAGHSCEVREVPLADIASCDRRLRMQVSCGAFQARHARSL